MKILLKLITFDCIKWTCIYFFNLFFNLTILEMNGQNDENEDFF